MATWTNDIDDVLGGDQVLALAHVTPAEGVVVNPITNFAMQDSEAGTVAVSSSIGMWRKLERIQRNPRVALAYHTRAHALSDRPQYVLVQGTASFPSLADPDAWLEGIGQSWERFGGQPRDLGPVWERWLRIYHWRVNVTVTVERLLVWSDLRCRGNCQVHGAPLPPGPARAQRPPAKGIGPRIDHRRAARRASRRADVLLGWVGADGLPVIVPVAVCGVGERGIVLDVPPGIVPAGGRRAGLTAHSFARHAFGQHQHKHTGWLEAEPGASRVHYAPHTKAGYWLPRSRLLYRIAAGFVSHRGYRAGRRAGFLPDRPAGADGVR